MIPEAHQALIPWSHYWLTLNPRSRDVYLAICSKYHDRGFAVTFPWGEARDRLKIGKGTFWRSIDQLLCLGWIERAHKGRFPKNPSTYFPGDLVVWLEEEKKYFADPSNTGTAHGTFDPSSVGSNPWK